MDNQDNILKAIKTIVQEEVRPLEDRLTRKITDFKDEVLTSNDKIAKELKDLRTEVSFFHISQKRQDEVLNNHENRLKTVETRV